MPSLNIRAILSILAIALVLGILNNFRVPQANRVTWFGGQEILVAPAEAR